MVLRVCQTGLLLLCFAACSVECTLIGCNSGLIVRLAALPASAFRVEVFRGQPDQQPAYVIVYTCGTPSQGSLGCPDLLNFQDFFVEHFWIRITTSAGTQTSEHTVEYRQVYPNGPDCGPGCRQATVTVAAPT